MAFFSWDEGRFQLSDVLYLTYRMLARPAPVISYLMVHWYCAAIRGIFITFGRVSLDHCESEGTREFSGFLPACSSVFPTCFMRRNLLCVLPSFFVSLCFSHMVSTNMIIINPKIWTAPFFFISQLVIERLAIWCRSVTPKRRSACSLRRPNAALCWTGEIRSPTWLTHKGGALFTEGRNFDR